MIVYLIWRNCIGGVQKYNQDLYSALIGKNISVIKVVYELTPLQIMPQVYFGERQISCSINDSSIFLLRFFTQMNSNSDDVLIFSEAIELKIAMFLGFKGRFVFSIHGDSAHYYNTLFEQSKFLAGIIVVSEFLKAKIKHHGINSFPILLAPHIDTNPYQDFGFSKEYEVIFIGRLNYSKGADLFIELCKNIKGKKILFISDEDIDESYYVDLKSITDIEIFINQENGFVLNKLARSKFLIHPSRSEGYGIVIIEAIKCGAIPLILKKSGGPEEILTSHKSLIFEEKEYVSGVLSLIQSLKEVHLQGLIIKLQSDIREKFNPEDILMRFDPFFRTLSKVGPGRIYNNWSSMIFKFVKLILKRAWLRFQF